MRNFKILTGISLLVCCLCTNSYGQEWNWQALNEQSNRLQGKLSGKIYFMPGDGGSLHFYQDAWYAGDISLVDGDLFEDQKIRYLAYGDELVAYNSNLKQLFIVDKEKVARFAVNLPEGRQEYVKLYFNGFMSGYRYFEVLYEGPSKLLAFHSVEEVKTGLYTDRNGKLRHTTLKKYTDYYMYSEESGFRKILPQRNSFLNTFPERKKEIRRIFRKNNFVRLSKSEMVKAFSLLDEAGFF